ncbi:MAG: hypothetical protein Q7S48_01770 [bacterium]|nr:hypothetical protein [bacterium]
MRIHNFAMVIIACLVASAPQSAHAQAKEAPAKAKVVAPVVTVCTLTQCVKETEYRLDEDDALNLRLDNAAKFAAARRKEDREKIRLLDQKDRELALDIAHETRERKAADDALRTDLDTEERVRADADRRLDGLINADAGRSIQRDNALRSQFNTERTERIAEDNRGWCQRSPLACGSVAVIAMVAITGAVLGVGAAEGWFDSPPPQFERRSGSPPE